MKDTEGSFVVDRVVEIAEATVEYLSSMVQKKHNTKGKNAMDSENIEAEKQALQEFTTEKILGGIHYYRVHDYVEQTALVNLLPSLLSQPQFSKVRLVVMDSITFHFRHDFEDMALRTRLLNVMSQKLSFIAEHFNLAVVLINQMTTKVDKESSNESTLVPALGTY